ncbi:MAG: uroporphyrinogen decarboxylase [Planctomycetota bacterium]|jgi:uroporphyrinogen decarboxylase|nr:uroporphyrinogen decarboxylase [Planctomycetota bacterium]
MSPPLTNDLLLRALERQSVPRTPVWMMRQAGRCLPSYRKLRADRSFLQLCKNPELATEVTLLPVQELRVDAAILFADILLPLEGMGIGFHFDETQGPVFERPIQTARDIQSIRVPDPTEATGYVGDAIRSIQATLAGSLPLIGFCGAPFTLAAYAIEGKTSRSFDRARAFMHAQPDAFSQLVDKMCRTMGLYLESQIEAGVHAVQIFDSWAGWLTPDDFRRYAFEPVEQILEKIGSRTPSIYFAHGASPYLDILQKSSATALGIDWRISLNHARNLFGDRYALQGNLDPARLVGASPESIREGVRQTLTDYGPGPGHIFNLGHGIHPTTPAENARIAVEAVREFSPAFHLSSPVEDPR